MRRLEALDLAKARAETRRVIGRRAYQLRMHHEGVRVMPVVSDRLTYEAGFSPHVHFEGPFSLVGDPAQLETFRCFGSTSTATRSPNRSGTGVATTAAEGA